MSVNMSKVRGKLMSSDTAKSRVVQTAEQQAAWDALYGDKDQRGRAELAGTLQDLYSQEDSKYQEGYALTSDRATRDQYRDAWKTLYGGYDNPYWTGDWGGQKSATSELSSRASGWADEVAQYAQTAAAQQAAATTAATTAAGTTTNPVTTALKSTVATPTSGSAKGTRSTYGGSLS